MSVPPFILIAEIEEAIKLLEITFSFLGLFDKFTGSLNIADR